MRSTLKRPQAEETILDEFGDEIYMMELSGYIFFGSVANVIDHIQARIDLHEENPLRVLILDFARVNGLDSSAANGFRKVRTVTETNGIELVLTGINDRIYRQLAHGGIFDEPNAPITRDTLEEGLEYSENIILQAEAPHLVKAKKDGSGMMLSGLTGALMVRLLEYLEAQELEAGEYLISPEDSETSIYFVESGRLSVYVQTMAGKEIRVLTLNSGSIVGEIATYLEMDSRTAIVRADEDSSVYKLTPEAMQKMEEQNPGLAIQFHKYVAKQLAKRLEQMNRAIKALRG